MFAPNALKGFTDTISIGSLPKAALLGCAAGHSPRDLLRVEHHPFSGLSTIVLIIVNILTLAVVVTYGTNVELAAS